MNTLNSSDSDSKHPTRLLFGVAITLFFAELCWTSLLRVRSTTEGLCSELKAETLKNSFTPFRTSRCSLRWRLSDRTWVRVSRVAFEPPLCPTVERSWTKYT